MSGYATPEAAVGAADSVPPQYAQIVAVEYSPDGNHAVVLMEYDEPPTVDLYVVLCERAPSGWVEGQGGSGGGLSWMATSADGATGVEVAWGQTPTVRWDVPAFHEPEPGPDAAPW